MIKIRFFHCGELMGLLTEEGSIQTYGCERCRKETKTNLETWGFIGYSEAEIYEKQTEGI